MAKVYAMIADGSEEVECLAVLDILKRSGIETVLVSVMDSRDVVTSHGVKIQADLTMKDTDLSDGDVIFLPGGIPGANHLSDSAPLIAALHKAVEDGRRIAAICAAPGVVLGKHGFLKGKTATCYPGFEKDFGDATYTMQGVVTDGNITTARGLGFAIDLGVELVKLLKDEEAAEAVKKAIQYC